MEELKKTKCACLIQGDIRNGTEEILKELATHFDTIILSTWEDEAFIPAGRYHLVLSKKPGIPGDFHRNYQRFGVARGLEYAEKLGCTHVLKWRTDMLPLRISQDKLLERSSNSVPDGFNARIVLPTFGCITKEVDSFSRVTDFCAFSSIEMMKLLWGDEEFDYSSSRNIPPGISVELMSDPEIVKFYDPEAELYALFKERMQRKIGRDLDHRTILRDFCSLFEIEELKICWFAPGWSGFRGIVNGYWLKSRWKNITTNISATTGYPWWKPIWDILLPYLASYQTRKQKKRYKKYIFRG